ncbi:hypothetical protein HAX54_027041 [Datura stramonium]|uniref:Uncharacterized protein n=1 Tax=Datura stramonium TaxID=4076 RepID=A0ABS8V3Y7_DATST|nr:hypothetical protein [Datura stramonium]
MMWCQAVERRSRWSGLGKSLNQSPRVDGDVIVAVIAVLPFSPLLAFWISHLHDTKSNIVSPCLASRLWRRGIKGRVLLKKETRWKLIGGCLTHQGVSKSLKSTLDRHVTVCGRSNNDRMLGFGRTNVMVPAIVLI